MTNITANVVVSMPSQLFTMARSFKAVANGKIYIGKIDTDPVNSENQIQVYVENEDGSHVPVSQPITINAAGYPVYNGQVAKFVTVQGHSMAVYDAYGAQQFYFPNVLKYEPDQLRQELAGQDGASLIYNRSEAVAAQLNRLLSNTTNVFNVDDYGAAGDASLAGDNLTVIGTDDTAAFIAAIAAAKAAGGGKVICTPGKTYLITYTILYPSNFVFDGNGATLLFKPLGGDGSLFLPETFQVADNTTYTTDVIIRNFTYLQPQDGENMKGNLLGVMKGRRILLEDVNVTWIFWHIFDGAGGKECVVRRVNVYGGYTAAFQFDSSANGNSSAVYGVDSTGKKMLCATSSSVEFFTYSENCYLHDNFIANFPTQTGAAFHWHGTGCKSIFVYNNKMNNVYKSFTSDPGTQHNEVTIANNVAVNCVFGGIMQAMHTNLIINGNVFHSVKNSNHAIAINDDKYKANKYGLTITNNNVIGFERGFQTHNYLGVVISNNTFRNVGSGLPISAEEVLTSAIGCIVTVNCGQVVITGNSFAGCKVRGHIICKTSIDADKKGPVSISGNVGSSGGPGIVARGLLNSTISGNSFRVVSGCFYGIAEVLGISVIVSNNNIQMVDGEAAVYSSGLLTTVNGNLLQSAGSTGYGIRFVAAPSPRSSMNTVNGFTASKQIFLDTTTSSGRHCEPFATISKAAGASGKNYTPASMDI
ncbi:phage head-binding domain-containing protein [Escherichia albertii]|uniref:phage head-binding domain-containing protein n=1 Tax=Escherichia albertii TaxID=208962 RepID=UPI00235E5286|nr:phage head-binding domain-containing protein [Escherichia albertii]WDB23180.1 phage head-binding domain-containing protein [Escherichia albertii]